MQEALRQPHEFTVDDQVHKIVQDVDQYTVPKFSDIIFEYPGVYGDALDAQERGETIDEAALARLRTVADLEYWRDPESREQYARILAADRPSDLGAVDRSYFDEYRTERKQIGKRADFRAFQTYAYKLTRLAEEIDNRQAKPEAAKPPEDAAPQETTAEFSSDNEPEPVAAGEANDSADATTEPPAGRKRAAKRKAAADTPLKAPEAAKPRRNVSRRTLASIGGLASLTEVASLRNSKGVDHFYGFDNDGKMWHISRDEALEWYGNYDKDISNADLPVAAPSIAESKPDVDDGLLAWLGVSAAEYDALSADDLKEKWQQAIARDKAVAQHEADERVAAAQQAAQIATAAAAIPASTPTPAPASAPVGQVMTGAPARPSLWQRIKDKPNEWYVNGMEWVRNHKTRSALGGLAVAAAVYGTAFLLTRDHSAAHDAISQLPPSGGGAGSSAHETTQQALSSSGGRGTSSVSATNPNLIDGSSANGTPKTGGAATNPKLIDDLSGHATGGSGAANPNLIDNLSGHAKGGNGATNPSLIDDLSGHGAAGSEKLPHAVTLSLTRGGDSIWHEVTHYLTANGYTHNDVAVDTVKDAVLKHMHLSEAAARGLPVGYHFTIPRAVLEELLKAKK